MFLRNNLKLPYLAAAPFPLQQIQFYHSQELCLAITFCWWKKIAHAAVLGLPYPLVYSHLDKTYCDENTIKNMFMLSSLFVVI